MPSMDQTEKMFLDVFPIRVHLLTNGQRIGGSATRVQYIWAGSSLSSRHMRLSKSEIRSFHIDYRKFLKEVAQSIEYDPARDALGWIYQSNRPDSIPSFLEIGGGKELHKALAMLVNSSKASMEAVDLYIFSPRVGLRRYDNDMPEGDYNDSATPLYSNDEDGKQISNSESPSEQNASEIEIPKLNHENNDIPDLSLPAPILHTQKCQSSATKRVHLSPPTSPPESPPRQLASSSQTHASSHRSLNPKMSATSPPHSPLPKRQKPNPASPSQSELPSQSIEATMSASETSVPVTKVSAEPPLLIKKLSDKARLPTRGSAFAAGYDLYAAKDTVVPSRGKVLVDTDISMAVPEGTCSLPLHFSTVTDQLKLC